jgi:hypothetical protein
MLKRLGKYCLTFGDEKRTAEAIEKVSHNSRTMIDANGMRAFHEIVLASVTID